MNMAPWQLSPILFMIAKILDVFADMPPFAGQPEQPLLHGISSILQVVTIYLISKGVILAVRGSKRRS